MTNFGVSLGVWLVALGSALGVGVVFTVCLCVLASRADEEHDRFVHQLERDYHQ